MSIERDRSPIRKLIETLNRDHSDLNSNSSDSPATRTGSD